jgi:hypothetical protein
MAAEATAESKPVATPPKGGRLLPLVIVAVLMGLEGVGVFFLARALSGGPASAHGEETPSHSAGSGGEHGTGGSAGPVDEFGEVAIADCKPSNVFAGKLITCHIRVSALVKAADLAKAQALVQARQARLDDRVNAVIRSAELKQLEEPGLDSIKRRLKHELDVIFGDDQLVQQVLIPQLLQSGRL